MIITTAETINGKKLETIGVVHGSTVQTVNVLRDFGAGLKNLIGGELKKYTEMMDEARAVAEERMIEEAKKKGADAIIGVRFTSSSIAQQAAEAMVYGTAVKFVK